jgi:signal transduction histidine kinase
MASPHLVFSMQTILLQAFKEQYSKHMPQDKHSTTRKLELAERKIAELQEQLRLVTEGLEMRIEQRIAQLVELNKSKDEFIALVSHELRTPASAVKQYLGMLMEGYAGAVSDSHMPFLQTAYDSNERQIKIINDLLRVAQLDLKHVDLHVQTIDATKTLRTIVKELSRTTHKKHQALIIKQLPEELMLKADPVYLRLALTNIIENALKYSPEGKDIEISTTVTGKMLEIAIKDEGVGIAKEDMPKLFQKFSRIPNPLSIAVGGTGLGLYWSREVIRLMGGDITVHSALNKGSVFTISLPYTTKK